MNKKLPSIFANRIDQSIHNNKSVFYSEKENQNLIPKIVETKRESEVSKKEVISGNHSTLVEEQLLKIFKNNQHTFNISVIIETEEKSYDTQIAGRIRDHIITLDNDSIPVKKIKNIIIKDRS